jgi:predicted RNase H-like HicB family nuclease
VSESIRFYPALVHKDRGSDFGISFPDFPGCVSAGASWDECLAMGMEALALAVDSMAEDGEQIPTPTPLQHARAAALADRDLRRGLVDVVPLPVYIPGRVIRLSVSMNEDLVRRIDAAAGTHGRSRFLAEAARARLATSARRARTRRPG